MTVAKKVILQQLEKQEHPERVEDVIFWALEAYAESTEPKTWGKAIAYALIQEIKEEEAKK